MTLLSGPRDVSADERSDCDPRHSDGHNAKSPSDDSLICAGKQLIALSRMQMVKK